MNGDPSWLENLRQKRDYLVKWLDQFKVASRVASEVQKNLDFTDWQIRAIEARPDDSGEIPLPNLGGTIIHDLSYLPHAYPWLPEFDDQNLSSASAFTSTGTVQVSVFLGRVGDIDSEEAGKYSVQYLDEFKGLQERHNRPRELRTILERFGNRGSIDRLDHAIQTYESYRNGSTTRSAAASDMRTLLDGVKGDLFELARRHHGEDMTWEIMASRLARGGCPGSQYSEHVRLEETRSSLVSRLSDILKDREAGSLTNLDQVWLELQDHLMAVLGLVQFPSKPLD